MCNNSLETTHFFKRGPHPGGDLFHAYQNPTCFLIYLNHFWQIYGTVTLCCYGMQGSRYMVPEDLRGSIWMTFNPEFRVCNFFCCFFLWRINKRWDLASKLQENRCVFGKLIDEFNVKGLFGFPTNRSVLRAPSAHWCCSIQILYILFNHYNL